MAIRTTTNRTRLFRWSMKQLFGCRPSQPTTRLSIQPMEDRLTPSTFLVTNTFDNGIGSLRAAITNAKSNPGPDDIQFFGGVTGTITLTTGELAISDAAQLDIIGPGASLVTVKSNGTSRVFNTSGANTGVAINLSGMTISNGNAAGGGGILVGDEAVTLANCVVTNNTGTLDGGGVSVSQAAGSLTLQNSTISNNTVTGIGNDGGGLSFTLGSTLVMNNCTISGNTAADSGGGIYFRNGGKFTITNSTISNNAGGTASTSIGGGLYFFGAPTGALSIQNSTISTNSVGGTGGGIVLAGFSGNLSIQNSTVAFNAAAAVGSVGGGIACNTGSATITLDSTIVAKNTSQSGTGPDMNLTVTSSAEFNFSLIGVYNSGIPNFTNNNSQLGTKASPLDPLLGPLQLNSGTNKTHRPLFNSPAIDKGSNPAGLGWDERGVTRALGAAADVGAVETAGAIVVTNANDSGSGSLRQAIQDANVDVGYVTGVSFEASYFSTPRTITLTTGELSITDGTTIIGPGHLAIKTNGSRHFNIDGPVMMFVGITDVTLSNGNSGGSDGGSIIIADADVTLSNVTLSQNSTGVGGSGGAIATEQAAATLKLLDCIVVNNTSGTFSGDGGGLAVLNGGSLTLQRTRVTGNTSTKSGGGIYVNQGNASITDCTVDNNLVSTPYSSFGGGIDFYSGSGTLTVVNTTISANTVTSGSGGGIAFGGAFSTVNVRNSTIAGNSAGFSGGGVCRINDLGGKLDVVSSVVSDNKSPTGADVKFGGTATFTRSAVGNTSGITTFSADGISQSLVGATLKLGPLADNGGPTPTHLPAVDSPLVNQGSNPLSLTNDQRGTGFGRSRNGVDIGAVEAHTDFVVTSINDSGAGSLRQAAIDANAFTGADSVTFDASFFSTPKLITLTGSDILLTESVSIAGPGVSLCSISGNNTSRIFTIAYASSNSVFNISGVTLTGGKANNDGGAFFYGVMGGAILNVGQTLNLSQCIVTGNKSPTGSGGAVAVAYSGILNAVDCTFSSNLAQVNGGAIAAPGTGNTTLTRCTITGNVVVGHGGGVQAYRNLILDRCTINGNQATGMGFNSGIGGGVAVDANIVGSVSIMNCTISANRAEQNGGGLIVGGGFALNITNCTITNNSATTGQGGGLVRSSNATTNISGTVISANVNGAVPDIAASGTTNVNFSAIGSAAGFTLTGANNIPFGANLKLGALANNGGPTQTQLPLAGSPLIDAGSNMGIIGSDQRGVARTQGKATDIGAVETVNLVVSNDFDAGVGSLRQCINDANINTGLDTITFDAKFFSTSRTIRLSAGELTVMDSVSIVGPGSNFATVDAQGACRVLNISVPGIGKSVTIAGMTFRGGNTTDYGGGIGDAVETLNLTDCTIIGNSATKAGGGIYVGGNVKALNIYASSIVNNGTSSHGGGISFESGTQLNIVGSTIADNVAQFAGGGIDVYLGGNLSLQNTTISGNQAGAGGGGVYLFGTFSPSSILLRNCTISGNTATDGGGIDFINLVGTLTVHNSTITGNTANFGKGGGIANSGAVGTISIESTIISGNSTNVAGPDVYTSGTVNATTTLLGSLAGITTFNPDAVTMLLIGKAPLLGSLGNNGGLTKTHALLPGSPAINNGSNPAFLGNDQRGGGYVRVFGGSPDIGAYEVQPATKLTSIVINNGDAQRSRVTKIAINFDQLVNFPGPSYDGFQLKRQSDGLIVGLTSNVINGVTTTVELTFTGAGSEHSSLADGRYTLTLVASGIGNFDGNGDGTAGDDYTLVGDPATNKLFRLFGDADGDGTVAANDFIQFRLALGGTSSTFDFDNDGAVAASDFIQFRLRFGGSI